MDDQSSIDRYIAELTPDAAVRWLLACSLGRIMEKAMRRGEEWTPAAAASRHIADWLVSSSMRNEPWIGVVDQKGRPTKLLKFGSIDAILKEADKAMAKTIARHGVSVPGVGEETFRDLADGFRLVSLKSRAALETESVRMQHCVGQGAYDHTLQSADHAILSLRDRHGNPHATIHMIRNTVVQLQGKQNRVPARKYIEALSPLLFETNYPTVDLGFVFDADGNTHALDRLPPGITVYGSLRVANRRMALPDGLHVTGDISFRDVTDYRIPKGLVVDGSFHAAKCRFLPFPADLKVGGILSFSDMSRHTIPRSVSIGGFTLLRSDLRSIPAGLHLAGDLTVNGTDGAFPSEIRIDGNISIRDARVNLPDGLHVLGNLSIRGRRHPVTLPERLRVGADLSFPKTKISSIPDSVVVGGAINATGTPLRHFPFTKVNGSLRLGGTKIKDLPEGLCVVGDLDISNTKVDRLPIDLEVKSLNVSGTRISSLPTGMRLDYLSANDCRHLRDMPQDLVATSFISARRTPVGRLPADVPANASLYLSGSGIGSLPANLRLIDLDISDTPIRSLPSGIDVRVLTMRRCAIARLPGDIRIGQRLYADGSALEAVPDTLGPLQMLTLCRTRIERLPENLSIENLALSNTSILRLPERLTAVVLDISSTAISHVPKGCVVEKWLLHSNMRAFGNASHRFPSPGFALGRLLGRAIYGWGTGRSKKACNHATSRGTSPAVPDTLAATSPGM
jgi:hypothetical protein